MKTKLFFTKFILGFSILLFGWSGQSQTNDCFNKPLKSNGSLDNGNGGSISARNELNFGQSFTAVGDCFTGQTHINSVAIYGQGSGTNSYKIELFSGESTDSANLLYTKPSIKTARPGNSGRMVELDMSGGIGDNSFTMGQVYTILISRIGGNGMFYGRTANNTGITGVGFENSTLDSSMDLVYEFFVPVPVNTDGDNLPDEEDTDDDNDGYSDTDEIAQGTDPLDGSDYPCQAIAFSAPEEVAEDDGVQSGLGGATPTGGVYSGAGVIDDNNGTTYSFDPQVAGVGTHTLTYTFTRTDGCNALRTDDIDVVAPNSLSVENLENQVKVYPNPVTNILNIDIPFDGDYRVYDLNGRQVMNGRVLLGENKIDTSLLEVGVYLMKMSSNEGTMIKRVIKK